MLFEHEGTGLGKPKPRSISEEQQERLLWVYSRRKTGKTAAKWGRGPDDKGHVKG